MKKAPKDVDAYIAAARPEVRGKLKELRALIQETAPDAVEKISYGMPYYAYQGRLVYFSAWKNHIGLYAFTAPVLAKFKRELEGYVTPKGTLKFPLDEDLPAALIKKLILAQMRENERAASPW